MAGTAAVAGTALVGTAAVAGTAALAGTAAVAAGASASGALETAVLSEAAVTLNNLNFENFDGTINIFNTSLERKLQDELNKNTKFFEVFDIFLNSHLVLDLIEFFRQMIAHF